MSTSLAPISVCSLALATPLRCIVPLFCNELQLVFSLDIPYFIPSYGPSDHEGRWWKIRGGGGHILHCCLRVSRGLCIIFYNCGSANPTRREVTGSEI